MALLSLGVLLAGCGAKPTVKAATSHEISPLIDQEGADPFVTRYQDGYLYTKTTGHDVSIARCNDLADGVAASLELTLGEQNLTRDLYAGEDYEPVYFPVRLEKGTNELRINSYMGGTTIKLLALEVRT